MLPSDAPSAAASDADATLRQVAAIWWASLTPAEKRRLGRWSGVETRNDQGPTTFRAVITDGRINGGRRIVLGTIPSADAAAIVHDLGRVALGRSPVNYPCSYLARIPLPLLDQTWTNVLSRLYRHAGPTMRARLANTPNPFAGEPSRGPHSRPVAVH